MIQQRLNLGPQKNLKHVPSSSPNLLIESPNLLIRSFTSKAVSVSTRSYVIQELWILFSTAFNNIIFLVLRFWWHISCIGPNYLFCIRQVLNLYIKFCTCQRHKTVNEFRWFGIIEHKVNHNQKKKGCLIP